MTNHENVPVQRQPCGHRARKSLEAVEVDVEFSSGGHYRVAGTDRSLPLAATAKAARAGKRRHSRNLSGVVKKTMPIFTGGVRYVGQVHIKRGIDMRPTLTDE